MEVPLTKTGTQYLESGIQGVDSRIQYCLGFPSLRRRRNLTLVSNVCKAAPKSLFWAPNGLNELLDMRFEFPFNLIGKSTMAFFNRLIDHGAYSNVSTQVEAYLELFNRRT